MTETVTPAESGPVDLMLGPAPERADEMLAYHCGRFEDATHLANVRAAMHQFAAACVQAERERLATAPIDYRAAVEHCYATLKHASGTKGCIAFARGAEWSRAVLLGPNVAIEPDREGASRSGSARIAG